MVNVFSPNSMIEFQLSSHKRGYGLDEMLSTDIAEYWASDAVLPHKITIKFNRKEYIHNFDLYLSFIKDDSYTPEVVRWFFNNEAHETRLFEPEGWISFAVGQRVVQIDIIIVSNHTDGKDSHVHGLRLMTSPQNTMQF